MTWHFEVVEPQQRVHHNGPIRATVVGGQLQVMFRTGPFGMGGAGGQRSVGLMLSRRVGDDWISEEVQGTADAGHLVDVSGQDGILDWVYLAPSGNEVRPQHLRSTTAGLVASDIPVVSEQLAAVGLACSWWDGALFVLYDVEQPDGQRDLWAAVGDAVQSWQRELVQVHTPGHSTGIDAASIVWRDQISVFFLRQDDPGHARLEHAFQRKGIPGWQSHVVDGVSPLGAPTAGAVPKSLVGGLAVAARDTQLDVFYLQDHGDDHSNLDIRHASYILDQGWSATTLTTLPFVDQPASAGITAVIHAGTPHLVWTPPNRNAVAVWAVGPTIDVDGFELGAPISSVSLSAVSTAGVLHIFYATVAGQLVHAWQ
jgi:hypothetical protein